MLEKLRQCFHDESYEIKHPVNGEPTMVVDLADVDILIQKHDYLTLGGFLTTVAPLQIIAVKAGTTVNEYDFLGTAELALNNGICEAFKNISHRQMDMNVAKGDVRTGYHKYNDADGNDVDEPVLYVFIN